MLRNRLDIHDDILLAKAEREISTLAASEIEFVLPPYDLDYFQRIHRQLFGDIYDWAGDIRTIDISKGDTRFCSAHRIQPEANKLFRTLLELNWFEGMDRMDLVVGAARFYGNLNIIHPFREGNGRAQRLLFEHITINVGYQIDWWQVDEGEWLQANIDAVVCDYRAMIVLFNKCIGNKISE